MIISIDLSMPNRGTKRDGSGCNGLDLPIAVGMVALVADPLRRGQLVDRAT